MHTASPSTGHDRADLAGGENRPPPQPYSNPYVAGFGLGLVLLAAFVIMGRGLGASGAFTSLVAAGVNAVAPAHAQANPFYAEYLGDGSRNPLMDWLVFEVLGVFVGGFISGTLAGPREDGDRARPAASAPQAGCCTHLSAAE